MRLGIAEDPAVEDERAHRADGAEQSDEGAHHLLRDHVGDQVLIDLHDVVVEEEESGGEDRDERDADRAGAASQHGNRGKHAMQPARERRGKPEQTRKRQTGMLHQSRNGRRRPIGPRCRSLCIPMIGTKQIVRIAWQAVLHEADQLVAGAQPLQLQRDDVGQVLHDLQAEGPPTASRT